MHTPSELQEIITNINQANELEKIITDQTIEAVRNEWYLEDMEDLPEEEMEAELLQWWAGRELA